MINVSGAAADQPPGERELDGRFQRHVEQEERQAGNSCGALAGGREERGTPDRRGGGELLVERFEEPSKIRPAERQLTQRRRLDARHGEIVQRPRQRARESGGAGHGAEVGEPLVICLVRAHAPAVRRTSRARRRLPTR